MNEKKEPPHPLIYLDHAATSFPKPPCVPKAVLYYMTKVGCNVNRGCYNLAYSAENVLYETREALCSLFHGDDCSHVILTSGITASLNFLLKGFLHSGDHILVSSMEHNAVMRPLQQLRRTGVCFDRIPCSPAGELDLEALPSLLQPNTKAVLVTHASNVCGTLLPLKEIGDFCWKKGLYFFVDSAQTAGLFPIDIQEMNIDALAFTGHKSLLGPQGTGGFLLQERMLPLVEPLISGGTGSISHTEEIPDFLPDRFEAGTMNLPGIYGLHAALSFLRETGLDSLRERELQLTGLFLEGIREMPSIRLLGKPGLEGRAPVVSIQISGKDPAEVAFILDSQYGIQTRVGLHCAPSAHLTLGTYPEGTIRFSFGYGNTKEDVIAALTALKSFV